MKLGNLLNKVLNEDIRKPTDTEKEEHKKQKSGSGKLYYIIVSETGKKLGYIDDEYVKRLNAKEGKKYSPLSAAKRRLSQIEHFKE